jgi:hypothetical protein
VVVPKRRLAMTKRFFPCVIAVFLLALGCATTEQLSDFADDMHRGRHLLTQGQYSKALASFMEANNIQPSAGALAFAAMAAYRMNDIPLADNYLVQAQGYRADPIVTCIILGYRSLVRFSQGDEPGGRQELAAYKNLLPGSTIIRDVELMATSGRIDINGLQQSIDRQIQELPINFDGMGEDAGLRGRR